MKSKKSLLLAIGFLGIAATGLHAQVAINNSAANPDASAILDLKSGNAGVSKGFLPQAVPLTNVTVAAPVTSPAVGLIVYCPTSPAGGDGPGYYYWNGTAWAAMGGVGGTGVANEVSYWLNGNTLTSDTNLYYKSGNHWLGIGTSHPIAPLHINENNLFTTAILGNAKPVCFVTSNPMVGFNAYWGPVNAETYYSAGYAGMIEFDQGVAGGFQFLTAPSGTAQTLAVMTPAITILNNDNVGIGNINPTYPLHVASATANYTAEFDNSTNCAIWANGTGSYGIQSNGTFEGVLGITTGGNSYGLVGGNNAASGTGTGIGTYGSTSQSQGFGVVGYNFYATTGVGIGVYGVGSGASGVGQAYGEGVFSEGGGAVGFWGRSNATSGNGEGGYFDNNIGGYVSDYVYVAYSNGTEYKIIGPGTVSTIVKDNANVRRVMACPEAPEILFEDYGSGKLVNGTVHIDLDPTYAKNVTINEKHPLRVLITLEGDCNGVYVTNKTTTGFDVVELKGGTSSVAFTYEVIANRADEYDENGKLVSKNADNRFVEGPGPLASTNTGAATGTKVAVNNPAIPPVVPAPASPAPFVSSGGSSTRSSLK